MSSHIYLLAHRGGNRFKIGKANDIIKRARHFGLTEINWPGSAGYAVQSAGLALQLERTLLSAFDNWRLTPEQVFEGGGGADGATEWMRAECRERVEEFLQHVSDIFPHKRICGSTLELDVQAVVAPILKAVADRERRKAEKRERDAVRAELRRAQALASRAVLEREISKAHDAFWRELERHINAGTIVGIAAGDHDWSLVLLQEGSAGEVWQADFNETRFTWPRGAGGLVNSVWEFGDLEGRVCLVGLGSSFSRGWPAREVTADILSQSTRFLRSLDVIDCAQLQSISHCWPIFDDEENHALARHNERILESFLDEHLPLLQARRAAAMSGDLFESETACV
jgi:hypothetical protein